MQYIIYHRIVFCNKTIFNKIFKFNIYENSLKKDIEVNILFDLLRVRVVRWTTKTSEWVKES